MKASQFITKYIDPIKMTSRFRAELEDALNRQGTNMDPVLMQMLYGNEQEDLEIEQLRLDIIKTRAEIREIIASAAKYRADADGLGTTRDD